jgi:hypothetical protein
VEARDRIYTMMSEYKPLNYLNKECGKGSTPAPNGTMDTRFAAARRSQVRTSSACCATLAA